MRHASVEKELLSRFEYPVALTVEVTSKGVLLSKLRYLKTVGLTINETIRCPSIEVYCHVSPNMDPRLMKGRGRPMGIDWIFCFQPERQMLKETFKNIRERKVSLNYRNPLTRDIVDKLLEKIEKNSNISYKRLSPYEQGIILEPYCRTVFEKAGSGDRIVLQNVEIVDRESNLLVHMDDDTVLYRPKPGPVMEIDLLVLTDFSYLSSIVEGLEKQGFLRDTNRVLG